MNPLSLLILQFLFAIQGVESNHGKQLNHEIIRNPSSIHFQDQAIGRFGVMPNTVKLLDRRPDALEKFKSNPSYEKKLAKKYALTILRAAGGCPLTASILWLRGPGAQPVPLDFTTARFKRFVAEWEAFTGAPIDQDPFIKKYCKTIIQ